MRSMDQVQPLSAVTMHSVWADKLRSARKHQSLLYSQLGLGDTRRGQSTMLYIIANNSFNKIK